jgi:hypothetical protein
MTLSRRTLLGACLCALCGVAPARAEGPLGADNAIDKAMQVVIDPATGQLVPAPANAANAVSIEHLRRLLVNTSSEGLTVEKRQDGTEIVNLQGRFQHTLLYQVDGNGTVWVSCDLHGGHRLSMTAINALRSWAPPPQQ